MTECYTEQIKMSNLLINVGYVNKQLNNDVNMQVIYREVYMIYASFEKKQVGQSLYRFNILRAYKVLDNTGLYANQTK